MEAGFCRQRLLLGVDATVGVVFELDRRELAQGAVESDVVRLPDPVRGGELELVGAAPGSFVQHAFGLVEPNGGLGEGVFVAVADGADRRYSTGVGEPAVVADRGVSAPVVGVQRQSVIELVAQGSCP